MTTAPCLEKRRYSRTFIRLPAKLLLAGPDLHEASVLDISVKGLAVLADQDLKIGLECVIAIDLPGEDKQCRINAWGKVIYCQSGMAGNRVGFRIIDMDARSEDCVRCLALDEQSCGAACVHQRSLQALI